MWFSPFKKKKNQQISQYNSSLDFCTLVGQVVIIWDFGATVFVMIVFNLLSFRPAFFFFFLEMCKLKG